jgi:hypothetical protein
MRGITKVMWQYIKRVSKMILHIQFIEIKLIN